MLKLTADLATGLVSALVTLTWGLFCLFVFPFVPAVLLGIVLPGIMCAAAIYRGRSDR